MFYLYIYLLSLLFVVVLSGFMGFLLDKKCISFRTSRLITTFAMALTVIPEGLAIGWPFAIGTTILACIVIYYINYGLEELYKLKDKPLEKSTTHIF